MTFYRMEAYIAALEAKLAEASGIQVDQIKNLIYLRRKDIYRNI
mgnify:CR=1 FL=1